MNDTADKVSEFSAASTTDVAPPPPELPPIPHRAVTLELKIEADDRQSILWALDHFRARIAMGDLREGIFGGYDWGGTYKYEERPGPSHNEYADALATYLGAQRMIDRDAPSSGISPSDTKVDPIPRDPDSDHTDDPCPCGDPDCSRPFGHPQEAAHV